MSNIKFENFENNILVDGLSNFSEEFENINNYNNSFENFAHINSSNNSYVCDDEFCGITISKFSNFESINKTLPNKKSKNKSNDIEFFNNYSNEKLYAPYTSNYAFEAPSFKQQRSKYFKDNSPKSNKKIEEKQNKIIPKLLSVEPKYGTFAPFNNQSKLFVETPSNKISTNKLDKKMTKKTSGSPKPISISISKTNNITYKSKFNKKNSIVI